MWLHKKYRSIGYAMKGFNIAWREEANFRFHLGAAIAAVLLGVFLHITTSEMITVIFLVGFVLTAEALNTALEEFCDMVRKDPDPHIAKIKDLAAAAVFIAACTALIIGSMIFIPYILRLI